MASEAELERVRPRLFGLISEDRIRRVDFPRPDADIISRYLTLTELAPTVADALDRLGLCGEIPSSVLMPLIPETRICGAAITVRYSSEERSAGLLISRDEPARLADRDLYAIALPGDVAVVDARDAKRGSSMGGLSALWAKRFSIAGVVVDGWSRDVESIRATGVPVWTRGTTALSGQHRLRAIEVNGPVTIGGVEISPGDLIVADESGVVRVPNTQIIHVLEICEKLDIAERRLVNAIQSNASPQELARLLPDDQW